MAHVAASEKVKKLGDEAGPVVDALSSRVEESSQRRGSASSGRSDRTVQFLHVGRVGEAACFRGRTFARSQGPVGKVAHGGRAVSSKLSQVGIQQELTRDNNSMRDAEHGKKRFREDGAHDSISRRAMLEGLMQVGGRQRHHPIRMDVRWSSIEMLVGR